MARTWVYTKRNRVPLMALDAAGRLLSIVRPAKDSARAIAPGTARGILVVEFWNIGDVVLALPFLAQLRAIFPRARLSLLARPHAAELLENSDLVDEVITVDFPWTADTGRYDPTRYDWSALRRLVRTLRAREFDIAFESRMDPRAKIVLALSGARRRVAFDYGKLNWLLTDAVPYASLDRHRVDDWARLLEPFGGSRPLPAPHLTVSDAERAWAQAWLTARGISAANAVVAVHPGASSASKRWPLEKFEATVGEIRSRTGAKVVAIEDPSGYGASLSATPGVVGIRPSLRQMLALFAEVDALLCNDSGPMHLAAAVGVPTIGVFHAHAAREFAPFGDGHRVLSPRSTRRREAFPPSADALLDVTVAEVVAAVEGVLTQSAGMKCATGS